MKFRNKTRQTEKKNRKLLAQGLIIKDNETVKLIMRCAEAYVQDNTVIDQLAQQVAHEPDALRRLEKVETELCKLKKLHNRGAYEIVAFEKYWQPFFGYENKSNTPVGEIVNKATKIERVESESMGMRM